jgi:hypothetical protein
MTIKQWFYKHVNITFVLLFLVLTAFSGLMLEAIDNGQWFIAAVRFVFVLVMVGVVARWWDDRL